MSRPSSTESKTLFLTTERCEIHVEKHVSRWTVRAWSDAPDWWIGNTEGMSPAAIRKKVTEAREEVWQAGLVHEKGSFKTKADAEEAAGALVPWISYLEEIEKESMDVTWRLKADHRDGKTMLQDSGSNVTLKGIVGMPIVECDIGCLDITALPMIDPLLYRYIEMAYLSVHRRVYVVRFLPNPHLSAITKVAKALGWWYTAVFDALPDDDA